MVGNWKYSFVLAMLLIMLAAAGCAKDSGDGTEKGNPMPEVSRDPVTLSLYAWNSGIRDEDIDRYFHIPLAENYPHITLEVVRRGAGMEPDDLLASGRFPDLIYISNTDMVHVQSRKLETDLNDLSRRFNVDFNRFEPVVIEALRSYGEQGELYALPLTQQHSGLFYNKDLFDRFGEDYPKDLMTWDETVELARKMTRVDGGQPYIGMDPGTVSRIGMGLSLPFMTSSEGEPAVDTPDWRRVMGVIKSFYDIPGYINGTTHTYAGNFFTNQNLAMYTEWAIGFVTRASQVDNFNWDVATLPAFPEALGTAREVDIHVLMLSSTSPYQDQAFQVMMLAVEQEVQLSASRHGRVPVLQTQDVYDQFGEDAEYLRGKNWAGMFKAMPRPLHDPITIYDRIVRSSVDAMARKLAVDGKDINTLLREAQEDAAAKVFAERQK